MGMASFAPEDFFFDGGGGGRKLVSPDSYRKSLFPFITRLELRSGVECKKEKQYSSGENIAF